MTYQKKLAAARQYIRTMDPSYLSSVFSVILQLVFKLDKIAVLFCDFAGILNKLFSKLGQKRSALLAQNDLRHRHSSIRGEMYSGHMVSFPGQQMNGDAGEKILCIPNKNTNRN